MEYSTDPEKDALPEVRELAIWGIILTATILTGTAVIILSVFFGPSVLLVASNVAFIIPSIKSVYLHRWTRAVLYFFMIFASSFYHACNSWSAQCIFQANTSRKLDFFFAQLLIPVTALYIIRFPYKYAFIERWLIMFFALGLFVVEVFLNEPFAAQIIVAGLSLLMVFTYWIIFAGQGQNRTNHVKFPTYDWQAFTMGIAFTAIACVLFATQKNWHLGYVWVHTVWHTCAALGQYWILCIRDAEPRDFAIDKRIIKQRL